jgi:hypothetical protein
MKWHKVTSFHVQKDSPYQESFMKHIHSINDIIVKKLFNLLKYSQKFFLISFQSKV